MKKLISISLLVILASCGSIDTAALIQKSDVIISTPDERIVWIKDDQHGAALYEYWQNGTFGPAEVHLVSVEKFEKMETWTSLKK